MGSGKVYRSTPHQKGRNKVTASRVDWPISMNVLRSIIRPSLFLDNCHLFHFDTRAAAGLIVLLVAFLRLLVIRLTRLLVHRRFIGPRDPRTTTFKAGTDQYIVSIIAVSKFVPRRQCSMTQPKTDVALALIPNKPDVTG